MGHRTTIGILCVLAAASVVFTWPLWAHLDHWGIQDWDFNYFKQAAAARTMQEYGQYPLWNPWYFGGTPMLGEPESRIFYPTFPIYFSVDAVRGLKLEVILHYFLGACGALVLARHYRVSVYAAVTASIVYMFSGVFAMSLSSGMAMFMVAAYAPWVFWAYLRSLDEPEWTLVAAGALALMFLGGAVHFAALTGLWLAIHGAVQLTSSPAAWRRVLRSLAVIATFAAAFSAVKLLPTLDFMARYPRGEQVLGGFSVEAFTRGLVARDLDVTASITGQNPRARAFWSGDCWGPDETGMYIGFAGLALLVIGIVLRMRTSDTRRAAMPLLATMLLAMWMAFGFRAPVSLWALVHELPILGSMRTPERLRFLFFLAIAVFVAFAVDDVRAWVARRWGATWALALGLAIPAGLYLDYRVVNAPNLAFGAAIEPLPVTRHATFQQIAGLPMYCAPGHWLDPTASDIPRTCSWFSLYPTMLSNRGGLRSDAALGLEHEPAARDAGLRGYEGEVFVADEGGRAKFLRWSPNRLAIRADLVRPGVVVVNQNFDDGWRVDRGTLEAHAGRLAVRLPAGTHDLELVYRPARIVYGFGVTVASAAVAAFAFVVLRRKRRTLAEAA